jgi:hypothetical protein
MTSQVNPYSIDGTFPVAGQDNNSQGFRDNFTNTRNNFAFIKSEVEDLQLKVVLKSSLANSSVSNDMNGVVLERPQLKAYQISFVDILTPGVAPTVLFSSGNYQRMTLAAPINVVFGGWPAAGVAGVLRLWIKITDVSYSVTWPTVANSVGNLSAFEGTVYNGTNYVTTFASTGDYLFEISTVNAGSTIWVEDLSRNHKISEGFTLDGASDVTIVGPTDGDSLVYSTADGQWINALINNVATANTVTKSAQPTITSVGTLSALTVTAPIQGSVTGSANTATTATTAGRVTTAAQPTITSVGTLSALTVTATIAGNIAGSSATVTSAAQPVITSVGTLSTLTVTGNISGNITGRASTAATVTSAAQPVITSVGNLTGVRVTGITSVGPYLKAALPVSITAGDVIYVSNAVRLGGGTGSLCFSDAAGVDTRWIDVTTGNVVV